MWRVTFLNLLCTVLTAGVRSLFSSVENCPREHSGEQRDGTRRSVGPRSACRGLGGTATGFLAGEGHADADAGAAAGVEGARGMEATDPPAAWISARVVAGAGPGPRGLPLLEGEPRGRARGCRKPPRDAGATAPSEVSQSTQNLPESLKCVFFFFLHHKVIIKLFFLLFA